MLYRSPAWRFATKRRCHLREGKDREPSAPTFMEAFWILVVIGRAQARLVGGNERVEMDCP
ncbi:hypothetical protein CAK95_00735 [Pseudorhodoplanes sinuspersici]|uniref:Uncharacterized protein n=1 Tax=Pseudorhodoplanes sinuspersici TaxID=1235591 RepID=A0A1W6ZKJ4_9HYPH|nr:hypothetical protein CAK95_00735 [Pseudorhodoplanes sinuspersici]